MRHSLLLSLLASTCLAWTASAQTELLFENFEDATLTYTPSPADALSDVSSNDYYGRLAFSSLPGSTSYANQQGSSFYGGQDMDGALPTGTGSVTLNWTGVAIAGFSDLNLSLHIAEDDATDGNEDWDSNDSMRVEARIDGGSWIPLIAVEAEENPPGDQVNNLPRLDTDFNGIGDGAAITNSFTARDADILATGSLLDLRIIISALNAGDEDIAIDNVRLTGVPSAGPPTLISFQRQNPATSPTSADSLTFRATFSEDVQNVDATDFVANGSTASVSGVSTVVSSSVYDITVSGGDLANFNGTVGLNLSPGQNIENGSSVALPNTEPVVDQTYVVDNTAPSLLSFTRQDPATSPTGANTLIFRATFSEGVSNVTPDDFQSTGTTANVTLVTPVSGSVYDLLVSGGDLPNLNGTVGVNLAGSQNIVDGVGFALPNGEPGTDETYLMDQTGEPFVVLLEDFEDAVLAYTPTPPDAIGGLAANDYFGRIAIAALPGSTQFFNPQGASFYGAQDIDNALGGTSTITLQFTTLNIAGLTNLDLSWFVAEDDDGSAQDWDSNDSVLLEVQVDGGGYNPIFAIEAEENPPGDQTNNVPRVDTDYNGIGDGAAITSTFTKYNTSISTGSTLDIRLTISTLNAGDEDIAFDDFLLVGDPIPVPPAVLSFARLTPATSPTSADVLTFRATFSEDVQNVDATDFSVNGSSATVTLVTPVNAATYDLQVSGGDLAGFDGPVGLDLSGTQNITDTGGAPLPAGEPPTDETYLVDNLAPIVLSFARFNPATSPTFADTLTFRATFAEDVLNVDVADFQVTGTTATVAVVSTVSPTVYDVLVAGGDLPSLSGTVGLNLAGGQDIVDLAGLALPGAEPATDETYLVDQSGAPPTVFFEDFEDAVLTYTPTPADKLADIAASDYFGRTAFTSLPAGVDYTNQQGNSFYGVQDMDGAEPGTGTTSITLDWTGLNIAGLTNLDLSWFVAEDDSTDGFEDWDSLDSLRLSIQVDGGGYTDIFAIEAEENPPGDQVNNLPRVDTNFDGIGDGAEITNVFTQYGFPIPNGATLDIRLTIENLNAGDEDIAFDDLLLTGTETLPPVADLANPSNGSAVLSAILNTQGYIDVSIADVGINGLDVSTITDVGAELTLTGPGVGTASLNGAGSNQGGGIFRYSFTGSFVPGVVNVEFVAVSFADIEGNSNVVDNESFTVENSPPVAGPDSVSRHPTQSVKVSVATLLSNDIDPDTGNNTGLTVTAVNYTGGNGAAVSLSGGNVFYSPNGHTGTDTFEYTVQDSGGATGTGTVNVNLISNPGQTMNFVSIETLGDGSKKLTFAGIPGRDYRIQWSATMAGGTWTDLGPAVTADAQGMVMIIDGPPAPPPVRFYRTEIP